MRGKCSDRHKLCQPSDAEDTKPRRVLWVAATASPAWAPPPRLWLHCIPLWRRYTPPPTHPPTSFPPTTHTSFIIVFSLISCVLLFQKNHSFCTSLHCSPAHTTHRDHPTCVRAHPLNFPLIYVLLYYSNESSSFQRDCAVWRRSRCLQWMFMLYLWPCAHECRWGSSCERFNPDRSELLLSWPLPGVNTGRLTNFRTQNLGMLYFTNPPHSPHTPVMEEGASRRQFPWPLTPV